MATVGWKWSLITENVGPLLDGLVATVVAAVGGMAVALVVGMGWTVLRMAPARWVGAAVYWVIEFIRSTPLLVQLYFLNFFLLPTVIPVELAPMAAGVIGLGLHYSGYTAEIYRSGIANVPRGQWEAATALGLSPAARFTHVILPQAIPRVVPALGNRFIAIIKDTPLLLAVAVVEILNVAKIEGSAHGSYLELMTVVAVAFLAISLLASQLVRLLERLLPVRHA